MSAEKLKKINKTFTLSDSGVNCYGYRLLTDGYLADRFTKNPIGYFMHNRDAGVLLRWDNVRVEGDKILAEPVINLAHPRAQQTIDEIENGFLNGASVGRIVPLEWSDSPSLMLEGQTGLTVTKWYNKEASLVDIPGNDDALSKLYDEKDNPLQLSDLTISNTKTNMNEVKLPITPELIRQLNLSDKVDATTVQKAINDLADKAKQADSLQTENNLLKTDKSNLQTEVSNLKDAGITKEVKDLVDTALNEKKITKEMGDKLSKDYAKNPTGLKDLLGSFSGIPSVTGQLEAEAAKNAEKTKKLESLSWDDLDKGGHLLTLKTNNKALYDLKFEEKFNKKPNA